MVEAADLPTVLRHSMACPALPTCGQAVTESERIWPEVAARIQQAWEEAGLSGEPLCVRMTGCPNGCARPYTAEIGLVGQSVGLYSIYVGGSPLGTRRADGRRGNPAVQIGVADGRDAASRNISVE